MKVAQVPHGYLIGNADVFQSEHYWPDKTPLRRIVEQCEKGFGSEKARLVTALLLADQDTLFRLKLFLGGDDQ